MPSFQSAGFIATTVAVAVSPYVDGVLLEVQGPGHDDAQLGRS